MTALIMKTLPTLPTTARDASSSSRATRLQSELRVTGDTDSDNSSLIFTAADIAAATQQTGSPIVATNSRVNPITQISN